jgi:hypothetical protein
MTTGYKPPLTADQFRDILIYERDTGNLIWKWRPAAPKSFNAQFAGRIVGYKNDEGYLKMLAYGRTYLCHRVIWYMTTGEWPAATIDHRNNVRDDNRWDNLRLATVAQNAQNCGVLRPFTAPRAPGLKGLNYHNKTGRWISKIKANGQTHYLGIFATAEEANAAYVAACRRLHGEFARPDG